MDAAAKFKSMQANARIIKHYRSKIISQLSSSIKESFANAFHNASNDPITFLENIAWMYQDIIRIEDDVVKLFPEDYDIFSQYIKKYHKALDETLQSIISSDPEAPVLLAIHAFTKQYKKDMKDLDVPIELLTPPLLDGKEQSLIDDYVKVLIKKLDEWTANLMRDETNEFAARTNPPEVDNDNQYGMQGSFIMFQMINQQVDLAVESGQGAVLATVVTECNRVMRETQDRWTKLVDSELKKQFEKPQEAASGLVEYVMALANDQIKCADYTEALSTRVEPLVSEKYKKIISERLSDAIDGYLDVAKKCTQTLIDVIFNDLKPASKQLFTPVWYDGIMLQIVETMRDYMSDYQTYLNPSILELLVEDLIDTFLITYLTALRRCSKLKMPDAADRIKQDISSVFILFASFKPEKELERYFEVIDQIHGMLTASKGLVFLSFWPFAKQHGPNIPFVEALMKARDDLDRAAVGDVMEAVRRKVKEDNLADRKSWFFCCVGLSIS
jgi:exocyst complex component 3